MSRALHLVELLGKLESLVGPMFIVETGTIRNDAPEFEVGDGHSTLYIARWSSQSAHLHTFFSVDINLAAIETCTALLSRHGLLSKVQLVHEDSIRFLTHFPKPVVHFVYLDSVNDAVHIFGEFHAVYPKLAPDAVVAIDDSSLDLTTWNVNKGRLVIAWAYEKRLRVWTVGDKIVVLGFGRAAAFRDA